VLISPALHQDVDDEAVLVYGPPEPIPPAVDLQRYFVQMQLVAGPAATPPQLVCEHRAELAHPLADRLVAHNHGVNLPTVADNWHKRVEVCKVNGKLSTPLVPDNARDKVVFVTLLEAVQAWGLAHGYSAPPTEDCSDVYLGERIAQIVSPSTADRILVGQTLQVVGSAYIDDFANYTLEFGSGDNPSDWKAITDQRAQAVDWALLGV